MMRAAAKARDESSLVQESRPRRPQLPKLIGVTILTSMDNDALHAKSALEGQLRAEW